MGWQGCYGWQEANAAAAVGADQLRISQFADGLE
jgi:hypothetical protein